MDKLVIAVIICFFPFIVFYPIPEQEPVKIDNITSSTRSDWGGDLTNAGNCNSTLKYQEHFSFNLQTKEIKEWIGWSGGCHI